MKRYRRSRETLDKTLSMLCNFVWSGRTRVDDHMWSIPVDAERDFDCILSDAIHELEARREVMRGAGMTLADWDEPYESA